MPILAIRDQEDVERLRRAVTTQYEADLLETLIAWRWRYDDAMKLIEYTAKTCLEDSRDDCSSLILEGGKEKTKSAKNTIAHFRGNL